MNDLGTTNYIDPVRDFNAKGDGVSDDTAVLQHSLQTAFVERKPVRLPMRPFKTGPLYIPGPGVYLYGEGYLGMGEQDGGCTVLIARDSDSDSGPLLSFDASRATGSTGSPVQWLRNVGMHRVHFDVSRSSRFHTLNPPAVVSLLGVSNISPIRECVVYGSIGEAFYVGTNPAVETAWSENISLVDCGCYGGFAPGGVLGDRPPAPGMAFVRVSGADRVKVVGGLWAYGCSPLPIPYTNTLIDPVAFHWRAETRPSRAGVNVGTDGGVWGAAVANMPVTVRVSVMDYPQQLTVIGPTGLTFEGMRVEGFHRGFQLGLEPTSMTPAWALPNDIQVRDCRFSGSNGWYSIPVALPTEGTAYQVMADKIAGGCVAIPFSGRDGDVTLGPNSRGVKVEIGPNPNQYFYRGADAGRGNKWEYVDGK